MSDGVCEPKWHGGDRVPATTLVMSAVLVDGGPSYMPTETQLRGPVDRFACCDEHVGEAVVALQDAGGTRFIVRPI